jgi:hypothetical protein
MLYTKEIFENWIRVVNRNQDTKLSKQTSKQVKPQETQPKRWPHKYLVCHLTRFFVGRRSIN